MRKLLLVVLTCLSGTLYADNTEIFQLNKPMMCSKVQRLIEYITTDYQEKLLWVGQEESTYTYIALYKNPDTGSWSLIQYDSSTGCFLGHGTSASAI
jgi:hypothetical protein